MNLINTFFKSLFFVSLSFCFKTFPDVGIASSLNRIVAVDELIDINGNSIIQVAVGVPGSNPNTWITSNISAAINTTDNYNPSIFVNSSGDFIILWGFVNSITGFAEVAAAYLLSSSNVWVTHNISQSSSHSNFSDWTLTFEPGLQSAVAIWSGLNMTGTAIEPWVSTIDLGQINPSWSMPFKLMI